MCPDDTKIFLRKRYLVAGLVFIGWGLLHLLRINLSICLIEMTSKKTVIIENETFVKEAEFNWSMAEKGTILSSFSWGLFLAPIGALISSKLGGVITFGSGLAFTALLTLFTPTIIQWNWKIYLVARILEGIFEGFSVATHADVFVKWAPPNERTRLMAGAFLGSVVSAVLSYPICGTIAFYYGWKAIFYMTGGATFIWFILWLALVGKSPEEDKLISKAEKEYLIHVNRHICEKNVNVRYPWKKILTSKPVLAYINDRFVESWSGSFLVYCLPLYMKDLYDVNIQQIGFLSSIPHVCAAVGLLGGSIVADLLRNNVLSITNVHRIYLTFAQSTAVVLLLIIAFYGDALISLICLSLFRLFFTICDVSYIVLPVDVGGRYAGFISSLGVLTMALAYTLNPIVMGFIITNHSMAEWSRYFIVISIFNIWGGVIFYIFGSGELQPWAVPEDNTDGASVDHQIHC